MPYISGMQICTLKNSSCCYTLHQLWHARVLLTHGKQTAPTATREPQCCLVSRSRICTAAAAAAAAESDAWTPQKLPHTSHGWLCSRCCCCCASTSHTVQSMQAELCNAEYSRTPPHLTSFVQQLPPAIAAAPPSYRLP
jgi:hypothetical protein